MTTALDLSSVKWRDDRITRGFIDSHRVQLEHPETMSPLDLGEAVTYCDTLHNPYVTELVRRSGHLDSFRKARSEKDRMKILEASARYHGFIIG